MFDVRDFTLDTVMKMISNVPDYQVMEYSLKWYDKRVLRDEDMAEISRLIDEKNKPEEQPEILENTEIVEESTEVAENTEDGGIE